MMLDARGTHDQFVEWFVNGGDATLASYNGARGTLRDVPPEHWRFLETNLHPYLETDTHIFVHAGAERSLPMAEQPEFMLRWERFDSIGPHYSGKILVCGHTAQRSGRPLNRGYAVCIDTHVYARAGLLTCLDTSTGAVWQSDARGRITRAHLSDFGEE